MMLRPARARPVHECEFEFERASIIAHSSAGTPYFRRIAYGMPRIPPQILNSTVYLYPSREDAEAGSPFGGTGFIVGYSFPDDPNWMVPYVVTNWHVAIRDGASVVRVNKI